MPLKFGTSGLRGLVTEMTPEAISFYTRAFLTACDGGDVLCVGQDLRPSSPRIVRDVIRAARRMGKRVVDCGALPTPALALAGQWHNAGAVMVTGSHIPADRNGLKFYTRSGEITKADESAILAYHAEDGTPEETTSGLLELDDHATARFVARYVDTFGADSLGGKRIGLYAHSAVGRDCLAEILAGLGATVIEVGRSDTFIPVDTEAVDGKTRAHIRSWVTGQELDALVSTDGDSDRPLLADEYGNVVPGDILGQITAQALGSRIVVTPISSNSGVTLKGFDAVHLTRIGSPYVIAGMQQAQGAVVGYEANGGFLLGFEATGPAGPIAKLMTRDCMLPLVVTLCAAGSGTVSARVAQEPPVITLSDRLQDVPQSVSGTLMTRLSGDTKARTSFLATLKRHEVALDQRDGLRIVLEDGEVVHVRPSGNAPELRLYVEAKTSASAHNLMDAALTALKEIIASTEN